MNASNTLHRRPVKVCREVFSGRYMAINNMGDMPHGKRWRETIKLARDILAGKIQDPTDGAQFFECTLWKSCKVPPWWASGMQNTGKHGTQIFYKEQ